MITITGTNMTSFISRTDAAEMNMTHREIAEILGVHMDTVRLDERTALQKIRAIFYKHGILATDILPD